MCIYTYTVYIYTYIYVYVCIDHSRDQPSSNIGSLDQSLEVLTAHTEPTVLSLAHSAETLGACCAVV